MFMTLFTQSTACSIDTNKTLYEIAYGEQCPQDMSYETNLPSPINKTAHSIIQIHKDQLASWKVTVRQMANINVTELCSVLSTNTHLRILTLIAIGIKAVTAHTSLSVAEKKMHADRQTPIKDRLIELQADFPFLYRKLTTANTTN